MYKFLVLFLIVLVLFLIGCIGLFLNGCSKTETVNAEVLTINTSILEGKMIGNFLGSSDGFISNDIIKVGVKFNLYGKIVLVDLKLTHAELAYYKDQNTLPLIVLDEQGVDGGIRIFLNGRLVVHLDRVHLNRNQN